MRSEWYGSRASSVAGIQDHASTADRILKSRTGTLYAVLLHGIGGAAQGRAQKETPMDCEHDINDCAVDPRRFVRESRYSN